MQDNYKQKKLGKSRDYKFFGVPCILLEKMGPYEAILYDYIRQMYYLYLDDSMHPQKYFFHSLDQFCEKFPGMSKPTLRVYLSNLESVHLIKRQYKTTKGFLQDVYFAPNETTFFRILDGELEIKKTTVGKQKVFTICATSQGSDPNAEGSSQGSDSVVIRDRIPISQGSDPNAPIRSINRSLLFRSSDFEKKEETIDETIERIAREELERRRLKREQELPKESMG